MASVMVRQYSHASPMALFAAGLGGDFGRGGSSKTGGDSGREEEGDGFGIEPCCETTSSAESAASCASSAVPSPGNSAPCSDCSAAADEAASSVQRGDGGMLSARMASAPEGPS